MKITNLIFINAILFIALGIAFALYGPLVINMFGVLGFTEAEGGIYWFTASFARLAGAALFGYGFLLWGAHDLLKSEAISPPTIRKLTLALLMSNIVGLFIAITQQWSIWINSAGWLAIGIFAFFTSTYAYFLLKHRD